MTASLGFVLRSIAFKIQVPQYTSVRFRYHADKIARGPLVSRYGYEDKLFKGGPLPRSKDAKPLKDLPEFKPKSAWRAKEALFGQNDYIDLLGGDKVQPIKVQYHIPAWIRGVAGNEYQLLLRKQKMFSKTSMPSDYPTKWIMIRKRIRYLRKFLNQHTKTGLIEKER